MRRPEIGTERHSSWWLRAFASPERLAENYIKAHALVAKDVMTKDVVTIERNASIYEAAELMEKHRVKRLPVLHNGELVGIIARADLVRGLAAAPPLQAGAHDDTLIRERIDEALEKERWVWTNVHYVTVLNHTAYLWGWVESVSEYDAMEILVRSIPGVSAVKNHLTIRPKAITMPPMI